MEKSQPYNYSKTFKSYVSLTKPGIIMGNLVTASAGFVMASSGGLSITLFAIMILGLSLVIASACTFNNCIDRKLDALMLRTQRRPLVTEVISKYEALIFGSFLLLLGFSVLYFLINPLAAFCSLGGFCIYVFFYSYSKYVTPLGTLIGSFAGAAPPLVGYSAAAESLNPQAWFLFLIVALWQMPHFYAIGIYRMDDYARGQVPILPLERGLKRTKISMLFYVILYALALFTFSYLYLNLYLNIALMALSIYWVYLSLNGFKAASDTLWARKMFIFSLIVVMGQSLCFSISM